MPETIDAIGPIYAGGFEFIDSESSTGEIYKILFLPDRHNDKLQAAGKAPVYYWVPAAVRLARKGDTGDYKFHLIHFVGSMSEETHVGIDDKMETVGGVLSFTTTSDYPLEVLKRAQEKLIERCKKMDGSKYWKYNINVEPQFRIAPIVSNITAITNLSPGIDGTAPAESGEITRSVDEVPSSRRFSRPSHAKLPRTVSHDREFRAPSNLDAWAWRMQGQGPGSVTGGENAYSGLIGSLPSEIVWAGFHGSYSPIAVTQNLQLSVWSQELHLTITGDWNRIFDHFSAHAQGKIKWFNADIKTAFNNLRINGGIKVEIEIDGTRPKADEMEKEIDKRIDLISQKFIDEASKVIFQPAPSVPPAESKDKGGGIFSSIFSFGGGFTLKKRMDTTNLNLKYDEKRFYRYNQPTTISSTLEGFFNEIKKDPSNEKKYFTRLVIGDYRRKVTRIVKPVVNFPDPAKKWIGDPVAFLSAQIGYPNSKGEIQWTGHLFQSTDTEETTNWSLDFVQRRMEDVENPPEGWEPDKAYIKRKVHLTEPPDEFEYPYARVYVEMNEVDLDPEPNGSLHNDNILDVRADSFGVLAIGPISLDTYLEDNKQMVEVEFKALGQTHDRQERPVTRFVWKYDDQDESRYFKIFTGLKDYEPIFQYRVRFRVRGTMTTRSRCWQGPWIEGTGNGPLTIFVPFEDDPNSISCAIDRSEIDDSEVTSPVGAPEATVGRRRDRSFIYAGKGSVIAVKMPPPPVDEEEPATDSPTVSGYNITQKGVSAPPGTVNTSGKTKRSTVKYEEDRGQELELGIGFKPDNMMSKEKSTY